MRRESGHAELNEDKWDVRAETFDNKRFDYFRFIQKRTISLLPLKKGLSFLDIGCGTGWAVCYVASLVHGSGKFYGVDISSKMIEKAKERSSNYENTYFCKANAEILPFENDVFDLIVCTNSFHHYLNPSLALDEIYRVLKSGGRICITDITAGGLIMKMIDKQVKKKELEHVKFYSTQDYRALFAKAKLQHITSKSIMFPLKVHVAEK